MAAADHPLLRIALLGADRATLGVASAIQRNRRWLLAGVCDPEETPDASTSELFNVVGDRARRLYSWEDLLDSQQFDAVIVARGPDQDRRAEQLRKLIQTGVPVLASHPVVDSMLVYYELDMIRREVGGIVLPLLAQRHHPAIERLCELVSQGAGSPIGKVEQLTIARAIGKATQDTVARNFAADVDLVRAVVGDMTRLGAMVGGDREEYGSLGVQMSGPAGIAARWSVDPSPTDSGARITLVGSLGRATVEARPDKEPWSLEIAAGGRTTVEQFEGWDSAEVALNELARAIDGETVVPDWVDAARSVELTETIDRSLKKSRTIELYYEDYTEEGTFKGTMTSVGCGLLMVAIFLMGAVAIAEQMGVPYVGSWPYVLLGACGLFLVLQFLLVVSRRQPSSAEPDGVPTEELSGRHR